MKLYRDGGAGVSPETAAKLRETARLFQIHTATTAAVLRKHARGPKRFAYPEYLYFDLHAGPGSYHGLDPGGSPLDGSPVQFVRAATAQRLPFRAWFFEQDPHCLNWLADRLAAVAAELGGLSGTYTLVAGDHALTLPAAAAELRTLGQPAYGLLYADPTGRALPVEAMRTLWQVPPLARFLDGLAYLSANNGYKRPRGAGVSDRTLEEDLRAVGKRHIWLREPRTQFQWTFAAWTNWAHAPSFGPEFHAITTPTGARLLQHLNLTHRELSEVS